ncbi:glutamyl-tRNA reductase [Microbacterium dauci]|uniref:Glutamyl-tRNA reductase n=1 Tax=Microbacterium dauci TaxID=3048008 RepID=A0ABT6ZAY8_9MICO|nr:glutamyl-tRNA reductase [Microbacterium sp. LX3-4]MDJ1113318.1 glutamyl-tRNA reductase [Microbacterium sp. LX3-4]
MLVCLTAHQRSTPFDSLERLSTVGDELAAELSGIHDSVRGAVVLATCNRFEAYFDLADDPLAADHEGDAALPAMDAALETIAHAASMPFRDLREHVDFAHGNQVAHHLFSVASGLDSVAVGEDEIAGQVRRALEGARERGVTTASLEHLFQRATETSRSVKNSTRIGESGRSLVRLAVDLVTSRIDDWGTARVLLVGTGRYAAASLAALRAVGAVDVRVHSPSGRKKFANREHLVHVGRSDFAAEAAAADVIVTCTTTAAGSFALGAMAHADARAGRTDAQVIIDLGLPRNVDPETALLPGVELLDLETIRLHAPVDEAETLLQARDIVASAAQRHAAARRVHEVSPSVVDLRHFVQGLLDEELTRARRRGDAPEVETALRHFSGVMMHHLIARGHTLAAGGAGSAWADAVRTILPDAAPAAPDEGE